MSAISQRLATYVSNLKFDDLPPRAIDVAKRSLLDAIGVSLAASGLEDTVRPFTDLALSSGGPGEATVLGTGRRAPMLLAALANGAMAHALDFEDTHDEALVHPNAQIVPALLAIADARRGVQGRDFLTAIAAGCDLVCRMKLAARSDPAEFGWYGPAVFGAVGAAIASAKLLQASSEQIIDAMSLVIGPAAASAEVKYSPQSHVRAVRDAFAAHAGLLAAILATGGVRGFEAPLEGRAGFYALYARGHCDEAILTGELGHRFEGEQISFKPWPACRGTHAFIELALMLRSACSDPLADVHALSLTGGPIIEMLTQPLSQRLRPRTTIDAKFSVPFATALALVRGQPTLSDFTAQTIRDPQVLEMASRISVHILTSTTRPPGWGRLEATLRDGRRIEGEVDYALGHPSKPLDWPALETKFRRCAEHAQFRSTEMAEQILAAISQLEQCMDTGIALFGGR